MVAQYRLLIIKVIIFLVLLVGIDFLVGKVYHSLELKALDHSPYGMITEYTMWKVNTDVVIMGASEALHSYVPSVLEERLGMSVMNCGKDGCGLYYQIAMVNGILDRYAPKVIIWSVFPNGLCKPSKNDMGVLSQLNPFYKENDFCRQALKAKSKFEPIKLLSSSYSYNSRLFPFIYKIFMPDYSYEKGGYAPLYETPKDLIIESRKWTDKYDESFNAIFDQTIKRCIQNGVKIVFVFTPRLEVGNYDHLITYKHLKSTVEKNNLLLIEDLYHKEELMDPKLFKDNAHLNNNGAIMFTHLLADKIITINDLE